MKQISSWHHSVFLFVLWGHPHSSTVPSSVQSATLHHSSPPSSLRSTHLTRPQLFLRYAAQQLSLSCLSPSVTPVPVPGSNLGTVSHHSTSTRSNHSSSHTHQIHQLTNGWEDWTEEGAVLLCGCPHSVYVCGIYKLPIHLSQFVFHRFFSFPNCPKHVWNYPASYSIDTKGTFERYWPGSETIHSLLYRVKVKCACMVWYVLVCMCVCEFLKWNIQWNQQQDVSILIPTATCREPYRRFVQSLMSLDTLCWFMNTWRWMFMVYH